MLIKLILFVFCLVSFLYSKQAYLYKDSIIVEDDFTNVDSFIIPEDAIDISFSPVNIKVIRIDETNFYPSEIKNVLVEFGSLTNEIETLKDEKKQKQFELSIVEKKILLLEKIIDSFAQNSSLKNPELYINKYLNQYENEYKNRNKINSQIDIIEKKVIEKSERAQKLKKILDDNLIVFKILYFDKTCSGKVSYRIGAGFEPVYYLDRESGNISFNFNLNLNSKAQLEVDSLRLLNYSYRSKSLEKILNPSRIYLVEKYPIAPKMTKLLMAREADEVIDTKVEESEVGFAFEINKKIVLKNRDLIPLIKNFSINVSTGYFCIPIKSTSGYYNLEISNTSKIPIIPGRIFVYSKDETYPQIYLEKVISPGGSYILSGLEVKDIEVKRQKIEDYLDSPDLLRNTFVNLKTFEITIKNRMSKDINIDVIDRIPLPADDRVKLKGIEVTGKSVQEVISNKGIIEWNVFLKKNEEKKLKVSYKIEYPKEFNYVEREE